MAIKLTLKSYQIIYKTLLPDQKVQMRAAHQQIQVNIEAGLTLAQHIILAKTVVLNRPANNREAILAD